MPDYLKMPPERDYGFYQRRKHDKWREVPAPSPALEELVADTHAHVHMLPDPAWELVRCVANGVCFIGEICDPSEDELDVPASVGRWVSDAEALLSELGHVDGAPLRSGGRGETLSAGARIVGPPTVLVSAGVHPHNAKRYDAAVEKRLMAWLAAPETAVVGEIGLDYHYDFSPRDVQRRVFERQIQIAKDQGMPIALHVRGGDDPVKDNAHREAFDILREAGFPPAGTLLHCCALSPDELRPWVDAGCYVAYGGALTFKNAEAAREGAKLVPVERLLLETDSPYMTPEPMRGAACTPAHVVFTAARLAEVRGCESGEARAAFLRQLTDNAFAFYRANR